ncbi:hypothetical protein JW905_04780 [bacterium]|nr:hypothetical protein [candidate division CSSED10-310 bacterium]
MEMERGFAVVKIYTEKLAIVGKILVTEKEFRRGRLSDYLNRSDIQFVPIHDAHVFSMDTKKPISSKVFVLLNKNEIQWLIPIKEPEYSYTTDASLTFD